MTFFLPSLLKNSWESHHENKRTKKEKTKKDWAKKNWIHAKLSIANYILRRLNPSQNQVKWMLCVFDVIRHSHTMTTSTTPTSQYSNLTAFGSSRSNNHNNQSDSYADYLCGVYNQRVLFDTASTTTTSTTFANLSTRTVSSGCSAPDLLATATQQQKAHSMNALPSLKSDLLLTDTSLFSVYHFIKSFITG